MSNAQLAVVADQLDLLAYMDTRPERAFGVTYDPVADGLRIGKQGLDIFRLMSDGKPWTLPALGQQVNGLSSSHSARIRQIREWLEATGRGTIESEPGHEGLWTYRIVRAWPIRNLHYGAA